MQNNRILQKRLKNNTNPLKKYKWHWRWWVFSRLWFPQLRIQQGTLPQPLPSAFHKSVCCSKDNHKDKGKEINIDKFPISVSSMQCNKMNPKKEFWHTEVANGGALGELIDNYYTGKLIIKNITGESRL